MNALRLMPRLVALVTLAQCGGAPSEVCRAPVSGLSPTATSIQVGDTIAFTAMYPVGCTVGQTTWSDNPPNVVSLSVAPFPGKSAKVIAVAPGTVTIKAATHDGSRTSTVTVSAIPVQTVTVSAGATLGVGKSQGATAELRSATGQLLTDTWYSCTWQSSNASVAAVSFFANAVSNTFKATVVGVTPGLVTLTASCAGVQGTTVLSVEAPPVIPVATVAVLGAANMVVGQTTRLTAAAADAAGDALQLTGRSLVWQSSDNTIAIVQTDPVTLQGVVTALQTGVVTIVAIVDNVTGSRIFTVEPPAVRRNGN